MEQAHAAQISQKVGLQREGRQFVQSNKAVHHGSVSFPSMQTRTGGVGNTFRKVTHAYEFIQVITDTNLVTTCHNIFPSH